MINKDDNLADIVVTGLTKNDIQLQEGDVIVIAQKIVSKAEGQLVRLRDVTPSERAIQLASETDKDPRIVELILSESTELVRQKPGVLIMRHRLGHVGAHAGIDQSNIHKDNDEWALLLPVDPDKSAASLLANFEKGSGKKLGVVITDSSNRPWRMGTIGSAIGSAGICVLEDHRGGQDLYGRELKVTLINRVDAIAATATLVMGETTEKIPAVVVRGLPFQASTDTAAMINRPLEEDLFR